MSPPPAGPGVAVAHLLRKVFQGCALRTDWWWAMACNARPPFHNLRVGRRPM